MYSWRLFRIKWQSAEWLTSFTAKTSHCQNVPSSKRPKVITSPVKTSLHGQNVLSQIVPGLTAGWTTGYIVYTNIQRVVQLVVRPLSTACAVWQPWLNNRLHHVNNHSTGCETGWTIGLKTGWILFTRCSRLFNRLFNRFDICRSVHNLL